MNCSIIIVNYNNSKETIKFVESIKNFSSLNQIIVVDNSSTDDSYNKMKNHFSRKIDLIRTKKNGGYAYGNNFGVQFAIEQYNTDFIIISNPDIIVSNDTIQSMLYFYSNFNIYKIGVVAPTMFMPSQTVWKNSAWKLPTYFDLVLTTQYALDKIAEKKQSYNNSRDKIMRVDVLPGSFFGISRQAFEEVNLFDSNTFLYMEENILSFKLKKEGYQNFLLSEESYIHNHSTTIDKVYKKVSKFKIYYKSIYYYSETYLELSKLKLLLLKSLSLIGLTTRNIVYRLKGD